MTKYKVGDILTHSDYSHKIVITEVSNGCDRYYFYFLGEDYTTWSTICSIDNNYYRVKGSDTKLWKVLND